MLHLIACVLLAGAGAGAAAPAPPAPTQTPSNLHSTQAAPPQSASPQAPSPQPAAPQAAAPQATPAPSNGASQEVGIAAVWNKDTVMWSELRAILAERAGAAALEEALLDKRVKAEAAMRGVAVSEDAMRAEESTLRAQLSADSAKADRLLEEVRARQGLGPTRWRALLWRNAALRAMVSKDVQVLPPQIDAALDAAHGAKRKARVIAVPDMRTAQQVLARLAANEPFADVAAQVSTDVSAARGGLISPVSKLDPAYPSSFREALWALGATGAVSTPVLAGTGFVIVRYEGDVPADAPVAGESVETQRKAAEQAVRLAQERGRMEELARDLVRDAKPTIFDESLSDSWKRANK